MQSLRLHGIAAAATFAHYQTISSGDRMPLRTAVLAITLPDLCAGCAGMPDTQAPALADASAVYSPARALLAAAEQRWASLGPRSFSLMHAWKPITADDTTRMRMTVHVQPDSCAYLGRRMTMRAEQGFEIRYDGTVLLHGKDSTWTRIRDIADIQQWFQGSMASHSGFPSLNADKDEITFLLENMDLRGERIVDTTIDATPVWRLEFLRPEKENIRNGCTSYDLRKADTLIIRVVSDLDVVDEAGLLRQHITAEISDLSIGIPIDPAAFTAASLPSYALVKEDSSGSSEEAPPLLAIGTEAPDFALPTMRGDTVLLSALRGKVVLLDFWYQGCYPCRLAIPGLQHLHDSCSTQNVVILGLNAYDKADDRNLLKFLESRKVTYPILIGAEKTAAAYQVRGYPTVYIIGRDGRVAWTQVGYGEEMEGVYAEELVKALSAKE
jgi:peroxiredoxin